MPKLNKKEGLHGWLKKHAVCGETILLVFADPTKGQGPLFQDYVVFHRLTKHTIEYTDKKGKRISRKCKDRLALIGVVNMTELKNQIKYIGSIASKLGFKQDQATLRKNLEDPKFLLLATRVFREESLDDPILYKFQY